MSEIAQSCLNWRMAKLDCKLSRLVLGATTKLN